MRPRCRVCGSRRCLTPVERERASAVKLGMLSAVDRFRQGLALRRAEERIAAVYRVLDEAYHHEECPRHYHQDCGETFDSTMGAPAGYVCDEGLTCEECEAVECECGVGDIRRALDATRGET